MARYLLYPFSLLYGLLVSIRNFLYDSKILHPHSFRVPVISVGNLTVGGTGKTPHAEYLISLLSKEFRVAYLSRGYKRKTRGFQLATLQSTYLDIGDEAVQIKQKFPDIMVAVCEKREKGIRHLIDRITPGAEVILLDDAFQHRSVEPDINILLIDYTRPVFDDHLLPVGRLREPARSRYRANLIIYTKCPPKLSPIEQRIIKSGLDIRPYQDLFFTRIGYGEITPAEKGLSLFADDMRNYSVLLVTGIAHPMPLLEYLQGQVGQIVLKKYPDHYAYSENDMREIEASFRELSSDKKLIITTEKDLVRLKSVEHAPEGFFRNVYYIPIAVRFLDRARDAFNYRILNHVRENRSNSRVHQTKNRI
ncbi:MAG TPA: tetraacyldisaccharide 4'-kinase [Prolixibacteraceae bacterium]|nr:tetraacyldisaccharide 4'-kinase [Prolixibacteraceae bacterium]